MWNVAAMDLFTIKYFYGFHQFASLVCNPLLLSVGFKILCSLESDYKSDSAHPLRLVQVTWKPNYPKLFLLSV